jgi:threonine/homoserine/homoserine lactone efflux protein
MDRAAVLNHEFTVAAYTITWCIQLGYLAWLAMKWRAEKREALRRNSSK